MTTNGIFSLVLIFGLMSAWCFGRLARSCDRIEEKLDELKRDKP